MIELHPGYYILQEIKKKWWTQKEFSYLLWKKISEVNELINGKRNITVQWDILLSIIFEEPEKKWINMQMKYDYYLIKSRMDQKKLQDIIWRKNKIKWQEIFKEF